MDELEHPASYASESELVFSLSILECFDFLRYRWIYEAVAMINITPLNRHLQSSEDHLLRQTSVQTCKRSLRLQVHVHHLAWNDPWSRRPWSTCRYLHQLVNLAISSSVGYSISMVISPRFTTKGIPSILLRCNSLRSHVAFSGPSCGALQSQRLESDILTKVNLVPIHSAPSG